MTGRWHLCPIPGPPITGLTRWLLIRRSLSKPDELAYYLCHGPNDTTDEDLIGGAGTRWAIEVCFQAAKNEVGLDPTKSADTTPGTGTSP